MIIDCIIFDYLDVDQDKPDKKLVMMYVSSLYESLRQYEPVKPAKRRKVVEENLVASASANVEVLIFKYYINECLLGANKRY